MNYLHDIQAFLPGVIIAFTGLITILLESLKRDVRTMYGVSAAGVLAALIAAILSSTSEGGTAFTDAIVYGGWSSFGQVIILIGTLFSILLSADYLKSKSLHFGEVYAMILFASLGMLVLAASNHRITLFLGIETMSVALYVLAGLMHYRKTGAEAALKYFLLGAFATGFLLFGIALIYGSTGEMTLTSVAAAASPTPLFLAGSGLLLTGIFFKIGAVPFHMWTPDVYEGTPTTLTGFMATSAKTASFVAFALILVRMVPETSYESWQSVIQVIAILTMIVGNVIALVQENVKRMLAYSSIAHAGYLLVGMASGGYSAVLFYLFAYTIMNLGAFGVIAYFERTKNFDFTSIESYAGLGSRAPLMGVLLSVFLFSLIGIPPFAGFMGKYYVFASAVQAGMIPLAVIGVLASAASVYYYLRVMVYLYFKPEHKPVHLEKASVLFTATLILLAASTLYFGIEPLVSVTDLFGFVTGISP